MKKGLLLLQLGTPNSPEPEDVGAFLKEFLMDKQVIPLPWLLRWVLVNLIIVPRRKFASSENYKKIWLKNPSMSPLLHHSEQLQKKLLGLLDIPVALGMRYQNPSIRQALHELYLKGCEEIIVFPMFPQFSSATTQTAIDKAHEEYEQLGRQGSLKIIRHYPDQPEFIDAQVQLMQRHLSQNQVEHHILSFHGLPEKILFKQDPSKNHCLRQTHCCEKVCERSEFSQNLIFAGCYRAQCLATAQAIADKMGWRDGEWTMTFQSRLGQAEWTRPYTTDVLKDLAKRGVKSVSVSCPAFTADCLETLEEIGIGLREQFLSDGGESFYLVPCLNDDEQWARAITRLVEQPDMIELM